jgi:hypothetical protein
MARQSIMVGAEAEEATHLMATEKVRERQDGLEYQYHL